MRKFELVLLIHAHQPVGNFDDVLERAYQDSYLPFIEVLSRHPGDPPRVCIIPGRCWNGSSARIRNISTSFARLSSSGQIEIVGGGFYEPILVTIPPEDRQEQIARLIGLR